MFSPPRRNRSASSSSGSGKQKTPSTPTLPRLAESTTAGSTTLSSSEYARKCRQIMELYWALRDLHVKTIFDLPRVAVIGGQSSGKSSLVEAVSGITVPRDSGTCTRCPMDCTMSSHAKSWSCTIELRRDFGEDGTSLANPVTVPFGQVIESRSLVELQVRRAQAAILSPHRPHSDFYNMSEVQLRENALKDTKMLRFSKNVVQVEVKDPNATDLTFVDLPGLVQNAPEDLITLVRELVEEYIRKKNTLIVIAMPMSDDIQNIQAVTLAKDPKADPERKRTIGVLTKPDTLTKGATGGREAWKAILEGHEAEHQTKHGYYCVRLPDDVERAQKISRVDAKKLAANFFATTAPWSEMADKSRFGIPNFVKDISGLLIGLIEKNLPGLRKTVEKELAKCIKDIDSLPPLLNKDPSTEILLRVSDFCKDIKDAVFGQKHQWFVQENKELYLEFKNDIEMTTPDFRPFEDVESTDNLVNSRCQARGLAEVRNVIKGSITWELPGHVPFEATKTLVLQYTSLWKEPSMRCFQGIVEKTRDFLDELLKLHFGRYKELQQYIKALTFKERDVHQEETRLFLEKFLKLESYPLFTQNFEALQAEETTWLAKYKQAMNTYPVRRDTPIHIPAPTFPHIRDGNPPVSSPHDELQVMAKVQAYFQVAHKRIIDYVPLAIEHELNQPFASAIDTTLFDAISKDVEGGKVDVCDLLGEDPAVERKRTELEDRKARLVQIKKKLDDFRPSSMDVDSDSEETYDTRPSVGAVPRSPTPGFSFDMADQTADSV